MTWTPEDGDTVMYTTPGGRQFLADILRVYPARGDVEATAAIRWVGYGVVNETTVWVRDLRLLKKVTP